MALMRRRELLPASEFEDSSVPAARRVRRVLARPGLHAFEAAYDPCSRLPEHGHTAPFFTYVLRGSYVERAGSNARECRRGAVIFHDRESHRNEVGPAGTTSFNVELDPELWRELTDGSGMTASIVGRVLGGDVEWSALRVWQEFREVETGSILGMEEAVALLCDAVRDARSRALFEPYPRLDRCLVYLDAHLLDSHRLTEVSRIAGVHPMHLAKLFRQRFGYSMGEYLRRRRIAWACTQLSRDEQTITEIAHQAGFADHAHFTRTFHRITGCTPRSYRGLIADC